MAIIPESQYPGKITPASTDYPYGQARNITLPGDGTGTPWEAALVNDIFGFQQAMLSEAGVTPSGNPDKVGASQYLDALFSIVAKGAVPKSIADLVALDAQNGSGALLLAWRPDGSGGGGRFRYNSGLAKSNHDGGRYISPTVPLPASYSSDTDVADYLNAVGETNPAGNGVWERVEAFAVSDDMYGALAAVGFDNSAMINKALAGNFWVRIGGGTREIGAALRVPSDRTLEWAPDCELKLQDGASDYLVTNDDLVNGNENIRLIGHGATINGNKPGVQTRDYTAPADDRASYWGFGFWLSRVTNLVVDGFYILETEAWGVAYWDVTNAYFGNLRFWQTTEVGQNGDGVTGVGSDLLIENISGYTNDDMVFVGNGGGTLQGNDMGMPDLAEVRNITVRNVRPEARDGIATLRALRISGRSPDGGTTSGRIFSVRVERVRGKTRDSIIDIANYWQATHPGLALYDIRIDGLERESFPSSVTLTEPHISIDDSFINDLTISKWRAFDSSDIPNFLVQGSGSRIQKLFVSDCEGRDETSAKRVLISQGGRIDYAYLSNIGHRRSPISGPDENGHVFYKQSGADAANKTRVTMSSTRVDLVDPADTGTGAVGAASSMNLAVRGTSDRTNRTLLTPDPGDVIVDSNDNTLKTWNGSAWV